MRRFIKGGHTIYFGDALEVLENQVDDNSIDLIFADPPYNIGKDFNGTKDKWETEEAYISWCHSWLNLCIKKLKNTGSLYVMTSTQFMPYLDIYLRKKLTILSRIIWCYDSSGVQARNHYGSKYEPILFCVKSKYKYKFNSKDIMVEAKTGAIRNLMDYRKNPPKPYNKEKVPGNFWFYKTRVRFRMDEYEEHLTQKPEALMERIIKASSNEGDTVLDPFSGSFTTSHIAKKLKRKTIGIEINEEYVKIGLRRLGISKSYNGEKLTKPKKIYKVYNLPKSKNTQLAVERNTNYAKKNKV